MTRSANPCGATASSWCSGGTPPPRGATAPSSSSPSTTDDELRGDRLLVATGRRPRVHGIGLETVGIEPDPHGLPVDEHLRAGERLWAIGDVTGVWPLTHVGEYEGDVVAENIAGDGRPANYEAVPRVTYTDPQAAAVGAVEDRYSATTALTDVPKTATYTHAYAESTGFLTLLSDGERLTGAYAVGPEAGEWLQQATLAIRAHVPLVVLSDTIQPFPSFSGIYDTAVKALRTEVAKHAQRRSGSEHDGAMTNELAGQTVVLIGGSAGIGLETARRARAEGAEVVLVGRNPERLRKAADDVGARQTAALDATDGAALKGFFDGLDRVDHVLITAGGPHYVPLLEMTADQVHESLGDHVVMALDVARSAAPKMRPGGTLVLMGGTGGRKIQKGLGLFAAATAVLPPFTATLALELAPVRVNLIAAGFVDTPLSASLLGDQLDERRDELRATLPIGRVVGPADVAALAVHLMTNTALTGATFDIDGGQQFVS